MMERIVEPAGGVWPYADRMPISAVGSRHPDVLAPQLFPPLPSGQHADRSGQHADRSGQHAEAAVVVAAAAPGVAGRNSSGYGLRPAIPNPPNPRDQGLTTCCFGESPAASHSIHPKWDVL